MRTRKELPRAALPKMESLEMDIPAYCNRVIRIFESSGDEMQDYEAALDDINKVIHLLSKEPGYEKAWDAKPLCTRSYIYCWMEEYDKALADLDMVINLNPDISSAYGLRGEIYAIKTDYRKAIADFNTALEIEPEKSQYIQNRGEAYYNNEDYDNAIKDFNEVIRIALDNCVYAYYMRGCSYYSKGYYDEAIEDLAVVLDAWKDDELGCRDLIKDCLEAKREYEEKESVYDN
jgi:tetratricopeptide (TPR) repeat protein